MRLLLRHRKIAVCCIAVLGMAPWGQPQGTQATAEAAFPRFKLSDVQTDCEAPSQSAKLCTLGGQSVCFTMPSAMEDKVQYEFAIDPQTERLQLANGGSWVFFSASFSACGSGSLERIAVLRYEPSGRGGRIVNLMPYVAVSNVSDRAMWSVPDESAYPLFVKADFVWGEGESHYSPHRFTIDVWRFDPATSSYARVLTYRTMRRYGGGGGGHVRVLAPERAEILRRLSERATTSSD